ncbi:lysophospholipase [Tropicimonas sp.]|uniref:alpha/beta hydrolase n=1 Tax=Tropicimonas sp. TaxID=2067044 RepID=UPI003A861EF6
MCDFEVHGHAGRLHMREWPVENPRCMVVLVHGYGEHIGRYGELAAHLNAHRMLTIGLDHAGHGRSEGERVLLPDLERNVEDVRLAVGEARRRHPRLRMVMIGHSMGGLIAARYIQLYGRELSCAVLSGALLNAAGLVDALLALDEMPDDPLDPAALSRDQTVGALYADDELVWHGPFRRETVEGMKKSLTRLAEGPEFACPTLMLHGAEDTIVALAASEEMFGRLKGEIAGQKTYPGARHEIFNETNRAEVFTDVTGWIEFFV